MLTFLFWNLKGTNAGVLTNLVRSHAVDVLVLTERSMLPGVVLQALNGPSADYFFVEERCAKIQMYTRFPDGFVPPLTYERGAVVGDDYTFRRIALPDRVEVLLCAAHFPSRLWQERSDLNAYTTAFARTLAGAEDVAGHTRTVVVGDLNMNPYDDGVVSSQGLHAVMTRAIARKEPRTVKFASNRYFYNPMWSHFGEKRQGHAGTYYYGSPKHRADFWNIYDQVLVRPALLPYFRDEDLKVLWDDPVTGRSLLMPDGRPNAKDISDHLPVLFKLHV
jgi:hypothetical protein